METWQRIGTYAAASRSTARAQGHADLLSRMDMIVAAGAGRDLNADAAILSDLPKAANPGAFLNNG